jgi:hypothetical protein
VVTPLTEKNKFTLKKKIFGLMADVKLRNSYTNVLRD